MKFILIALGLFFVFRYIFRQVLVEKESQFNNSPSTIYDPSEDLSTNQKYAIVGLLAYIQGSSPRSAYDSEANNIVQSTIFSLGLSKYEVKKYLQSSLHRNPEHSFYRIVDSLKEIQDRNYLKKLYPKALKIAKISGDIDTIKLTNEIFEELGFNNLDSLRRH